MAEYLLKDSIGYHNNLTAITLKTAFSKFLAPYGIAAEQFATLKIISEDNKVTQTRIAELLGKDKTTVGRAIESLVKKKLISREGAKNDCRANIISLTPKAQEILDLTVPIAQQFNEAILAKVTQEELKVYFKVLDIISQTSKNFQLDKGKNV
jgi:DNA-binding MarR family transcriptional regulator